MAVAEEEYVFRNDSFRDDSISTSDNVSYLSMNGMMSHSPSSSSGSTTHGGCSGGSPWPSAAATVAPVSPAGIQPPSAGVTAFSYAQIMLMLQDLTDFHYGIITREMAEEVCSEFGEFLVRSGRFSNFDLVLTVKLQSQHVHYTIHKAEHPFTAGQHIYFLDDKTRLLSFTDVMELIQFLVSARYLPSTIKGSVPLHPCLRSAKMIVNGVDLSIGKIINPNPVSSKTYYIGCFNKSTKVVLVKKRDNKRVVAEAILRTKFHSHPNIARILGVSVIDPVCLVLHQEAQQSLNDYVKKLKSSKRDRMASICHNVCCGMIYLHSIQCIHRSLLTRACIVDQTGIAKISDFDKSCFIEEEVIEPADGESVFVPTRWAAPEVLKYSRFSKSSDVWSFGVFVWEVFNKGKIPYHQLRNEQLLEKLKPGFRLTLVKKQAPYDVILEKCLRYNESNRPSFNFIEGTISALL